MFPSIVKKLRIQFNTFCRFLDQTSCLKWKQINSIRSTSLILHSNAASSNVEKPRITLFTKDDCTLCDVAKEALEIYKEVCDIEVVDIGEKRNINWFEKYKYDIPVLHLNGKFLMKHKVFTNALEEAIKNANNQSSKIATVASEGRRYDLKRKKTNDMVLNFYSGHFIDRCAHIRKSKDRLEAKMKKETSKYVIFKSLEPFLTRRNDKVGYVLRTLSFKELSYSIDNERLFYEVVFLGTEGNDTDWFAINFPSGTKDSTFPKGAEFKNAFTGMLKLNDKESSIAAQARGILAWHSSHRFCPECGSKSEMVEGGYRRKCSNEACKTRSGDLHHSCYPRVDPVTMVLLQSPDQNSILLGRKHIFQSGFFTCLAGFMEPGESFETTVQREIYEECALPVEDIRYQLSQCWPFPSSVIFGCSATAKHMDITMDKEELVELDWFTKDEAASLISKEAFKAFMSGEHVRMAPGKYALAHHLIKRWIHGHLL